MKLPLIKKEKIVYHLRVVHLQKHATRGLQKLLRELDSRLHVEKIHLDLSRHCT